MMICFQIQLAPLHPGCGEACETKLRCQVSFKTAILHHRRHLREVGADASCLSRHQAR